MDTLKHDTQYINDRDLVSDDASHNETLSPEEREVEKQLRRKIDIRIMPLVVLIYLMNYIDR